MDRITRFAEFAPNGQEGGLHELWMLMGKLVRRYIEAHRSYHTLQHLDYGFRQHNQRFGNMQPDTFFAWVYHDAIYDPRAKDNEEKSAELFFADNICIGFKPESADAIAKLILSTKHNGEKNLITDIDLSILGADKLVYEDYVRRVRQEYSFVNETDWRAGRIAVLQSFLAQEHIFFTAQFGDLEETTRKNLSRELKRLLKKA